MARKMKDSGIEWIGEIPEGWEITRLKYLADFEPTCDTSYLTDESEITYTPMECVKNGDFENRSALYGNLSHTLTPFQNGDIAMAKVTPCFENGNIAIMNNLFSGFGLGSSELFIFRPKSISTRYLFYWLQNKAFVARACSTMTGTGGLKRISPSFIRNCPVHCPSMDEQTKISDYLKAKCSEIDTMLSKNRSSIEEYKKLKQAVITQAVTKGVRSEREMKDSGVEWIGEIPAEWSICPLKRLAAIQTGSTPSKTSSESFYSSIAGTPWIKPDNLGFSSSIETTAEFLTEEGCSVARTLPSNTVYVGCIGSRIGNCGYSLIPCACNQQINALIFNARMYWKYGWYLTIFQEEQYMLLANGNVIQIINSTTQGNISCIVPSISEQREITAYLDAKCAEIDGLIVKKEQLVKELESYKKSLIYEVVTGKREV